MLYIVIRFGGISVAAAIAGVFAILVNKIGKIMKIFKNLDHLKS